MDARYLIIVGKSLKGQEVVVVVVVVTIVVVVAAAAEAAVARESCHDLTNTTTFHRHV